MDAPGEIAAAWVLWRRKRRLNVSSTQHLETGFPQRREAGPGSSGP
jgi:hypothetical protein